MDEETLHRPRMTEAEAQAVAEAAVAVLYPGMVSAMGLHWSFHVEYGDGVWVIYAIMPQATRGGGLPEVTVRDADGKVLKMHLSR